MVDDLFVVLDIDKGEYLHEAEGGDSSAASFMASVEEWISVWECKLYDERLNNKVKLSLYRTFSKNVGFKKCLHWVSDAGSRLPFKFRSGTHGLNEELGRHRGREGKVECTLCGAKCESIVHVSWECLVYSNCRLTLLKKLQELLGDKCIDFDSLNYLEKTSYVLGSELWEDDFSSLLSIVKEFIADVWESRKLRLYGENACPGPQPNSSRWDLGQDGKLNGRNGRSGKLSHSSDVIGACICSNDVNMCGSAHCGYVVNGSVANGSFLSIILIITQRKRSSLTL